jgi:potassium/hydrogen antiporter
MLSLHRQRMNEVGFPAEPGPTAALLAAIGGLLAASVLLARIVGGRGVPVLLVFMLLGMLAGSEGVLRIDFEDYGLAFRLGTIALALILFDGGLNTSVASFKSSIGPASVLATLGVVVTAGVVGVVGKTLGFSWTEALLLGAVVSSTDAAAVFSILRGSGIQLKHRVGTTLEIESGLNDPMAVILTTAFTRAALQPESLGWAGFLPVFEELAIGLLGGFAIGHLGRWLVRQRLLAGGLYPVLTISIGLLAFGVPTLCGGSGFLAVYIAGVILGDGPLPYRSGLLRVHDSLAWFAQIIMFLALGLLVFPSQLLPVAWGGLAVAIVLAQAARPIAVLLCLVPFRFDARETAFIAWVGLRGAVPIILATFPILAGVENGQKIFNLVFFVVALSALLQGSTVPWLTRLLDLDAKLPPTAPATLEIMSSQPLAGELMSFHIGAASAVCNVRISDLPFPEASAAMLLVRGRELIAPKGHTELRHGDHVYVFCRPEDRRMLRLLFAGEEE